MSPRPPSLSTQLTRTLLATLGGLWLLLAAGSAWQARTEINEGMDSSLVDTAQRLLDLAMHDLQRHEASDQGAVQRVAPAQVADDLMYQIVDARGRLLLRSADAPEQALAVPRARGFVDLPAWRVYTERHAQQPVYIHVADSLAHRRDAWFETTLWLLLPVLGVLPLLGWLVHLVTRRGLAPLAELAAQIGQRDGQDLRPIPTTVQPRELQIITRSTNHLLQRLGDALDSERALAASAAHELRTPLAAARLRLHAMLGMALPAAARTEAEQALASLMQLNRRAEKLLQMSRAESGAALGRTRVHLGELAGTVAQEFWADPALLDRLRLHTPSDADVVALGDFDTVGIVVRNLVENAVRHAPNGAIDIVVEAPARLTVRDAGPGVAASSLQAIAQRHVKRSRDATGYGLGLSIVASIVERHGGTLVLHSPPPGRASGFEAVIELRAAD